MGIIAISIWQFPSTSGGVPKKFVVVDNTEGKDFKKETMIAYRMASKFVRSEPDNHLAQKWIKAEKEKRGIKTVKKHRRKT